VDQGLEVVKAWLKPLFLPYTAAAYYLVRTQHGLPALPTPSPTPLPTPSDSSSPPSTYTATAIEPLPDPPSFIGLTTTIGHLALFNQHLQKVNRSVEWVYSKGFWDWDWDPEGAGLAARADTRTQTPVWAVRVLVDGVFFGRGRGNTKKAARNEAAKEGLEKLGIFVW
jgi:ribonuclease-3